MSRRILLADDSAHAQRMGERILRDEGYEVVTVTDGDEALRRLAEIDPDLIVADVFLPRISGFELCRKVKARDGHSHVRVVMTAGMLEVFDEEEARRAGADAIIKKPFESTAVLDTIKPLIKQSHAERGESRTPQPEPPHPVPDSKLAPDSKPGPDPQRAVSPAPSSLDPELIRAAVTVALDEIMPQLIDDITGRVVNAVRNNQ
jgi:DNA-binding response OmpR family regulator